MLLVESDGPPRIRPGPNKQRARRQRPQVCQQLAADPLSLPGRAHIGVSDQGHILDVLDAHPHIRLALEDTWTDPCGRVYREVAEVFSV